MCCCSQEGITAGIACILSARNVLVVVNKAAKFGVVRPVLTLTLTPPVTSIRRGNDGLKAAGWVAAGKRAGAKANLLQQKEEEGPGRKRNGGGSGPNREDLERNPFWSLINKSNFKKVAKREERGTRFTQASYTL
jgi:hypothetical protein